ncbi:F-box and leucine-rich repeat protein 12, isoform CRA_d [Rattus norvegicus]|uniref:F-box and leucine-rich repeat protein 12, isoform CRA_d n=1 Tax=Rattus norvegicus TaxID=10116 RepID=A6JNK1_RAT|nr:F-box and leucine-rich repeat protein 12, isoform CRA_d [Rattus norvegicus]
MATLFDLPDLVLLEIFSYLPVRDRIRISRVCHRWKRLVDDRWLWRHVDLTLYTYDGHRRTDPKEGYCQSHCCLTYQCNLIVASLWSRSKQKKEEGSHCLYTA